MSNQKIPVSFLQTLKNSFLAEILLSFQKQKSQKIHIYQTVFSYLNNTLSTLFSDLGKSVLYIAYDKEDCLYTINEIEDIMGKEKVLYFPATYNTPYQTEEIQHANIVLRTEVLNKIKQQNQNYIVVTYAKALCEKVITYDKLQEQTFAVTVGEKLDIPFLTEILFNYHFNHVDFVTEPGEFSVRGGIVDIFSYSDENPVRISFFGNEIETIRIFDIESQLSLHKINTFSLVPNMELVDNVTKKVNVLEYFPQDTLVITKDLELSMNLWKTHFHKAHEFYQKIQETTTQKKPQELYTNEEEIFSSLQSFSVLEIAQNPYFKNSTTQDIATLPQPIFQKNFTWVKDDLHEKLQENYTIYISFSSEKQAERLLDIFADIDSEISFIPTYHFVHQGFFNTKDKWLLYTDHQLFERYQTYKDRNSFAKSQALTLKELTNYSIGDYITHIDHGVGKFMGLQRINNNGKIQETIKIVYLNNDILYVNIHSLHKISRFNGKEGKEIVLNKLGSPAWKNLKNKTKKRVKEVAFDLIQLYAKRKTQQGFAFSPDGYLQNELEASFMYEDTPDQLKATQEVKADMEKPTAMDRLVCGDVGFGKTEVAIRAAFKAATDGKQVAILVPTTILAFQHYNTFKKRLAEFPVKVEYLSRFRTAKQSKIIKEELQAGKIEIIIGTQQLVSKDIKFKDLGLLIVDEEHKFGVAVKDKLKTLKTTVDTLTLTATPIPRTLQFSLMSARDMSVIKTPPPNRQPITTQLIGFNEEQIRDAILYELQRDGQVFFLNNRIENLPELAGMIQRLVPEVRIAIGHGQMDGEKMEKILLQFINGEKDILLSTTIIESGLDVPNANTIFINNAQDFGLADLHQMRGRVGRSNKKAFCYLIAPPISVLTSEARKRIEAITQFSDLGSGFYIAMKDLEIRGAGDLLGGEQSGFINDIGFGTYQKILQEAIEELKNEDFSDLFTADNSSKNYVKDVVIDTDWELLIPLEYVNNVEERFALYQKLAEIETEENLQAFATELIDRFGTMPAEVQQLLESIQLKWLAKQIGIERLTLKNNTLLGYFLENHQSNYYQSSIFQKVLQFLQEYPTAASLKQKQTPEGTLLHLRKENIKSVPQAKLFLQKLVTYILE